MKNEEAKFILSGYRPNGSDGQDAMFCDALRQAQSDPELGAWFERSRAHDAAVASKVAEIEPPAGLRERILMGGRVSETKRDTWRRPAWLAAAAAVAVLVVSAAAVWPKRSVANEPLVKFAMTDVLDASKHGSHGEESHALQETLGSTTTRLGKSLPVDFAGLVKTGCRTIDVNGRPVLEVCFNRGGKWFHCYIARCEDFPKLTANERPMIAESGRASAVAWADGVHRFVIAATAGREAVERLL